MTETSRGNDQIPDVKKILELGPEFDRALGDRNFHRATLIAMQLLPFVGRGMIVPDMEFQLLVNTAVAHYEIYKSYGRRAGSLFDGFKEEADIAYIKAHLYHLAAERYFRNCSARIRHYAEARNILRDNAQFGVPMGLRIVSVIGKQRECVRTRLCSISGSEFEFLRDFIKPLLAELKSE